MAATAIREREVYLRGEESGLGTEPLRPLNFLERDGSGSGGNILLLEPLRSSFFLTKQHQNWDGTVPFYFAPQPNTTLMSQSLVANNIPLSVRRIKTLSS